MVVLFCSIILVDLLVDCWPDPRLEHRNKKNLKSDEELLKFIMIAFVFLRSIDYFTSSIL